MEGQVLKLMTDYGLDTVVIALAINVLTGRKQTAVEGGVAENGRRKQTDEISGIFTLGVGVFTDIGICKAAYGDGDMGQNVCDAVADVRQFKPDAVCDV